MKIFASFILLTAIAVLACSRQPAEPPARTQATPAHTDNRDYSGRTTKTVPAFQSPESAKNLPKTLDPALFKGQVSAAYQVVREIPETIAQLPCYCHCDRNMGHKSLYTCYVDDHAANCGICMNSALKAYKLQKEKKMTPEQIREELIAEYGNM